MGALERYWYFTLLLAAVLEVLGDAVIRYGMRPSMRWGYILGGGAILAAYGFFVNRLEWDFGKLLGVYVAFFAVVAVVWGYLTAEDKSPYPRVFAGLALIVVGGVVISWPEIKKLAG